MPDAVRSYLTAILVLNALGAPGVAAMMHRTWAARRGVRYPYLYAGVLGLVALWGAGFLDTRTLVGEPSGWWAAIPVGFAAGHAATCADRAIVLLLIRRSGLIGQTYHLAAPVVRQGTYVSPATTSQPDDWGGLPLLVTVAVLEEIVFRGWLLQLARDLPPGPWQIAFLALTIAGFALLHIRFGWEHVLSKIPLGVISLVTVSVTGSVLPGVVTHVWFNIQVWRERRNTTAGTHSPGLEGCKSLKGAAR